MMLIPDEIIDDPVLLDVAEIWEPRDRMMPSEWAERERELNPDCTPQAGRWRNDYLPWIIPMIDAFILEPLKLGIVVMKYAQAGISDLFITLLGYLYDFEPGPVIFVCSRKDQARKFGLERFDYMIDHSPALRKKFRRGKANNETLYYKEAEGGPLMLAGSGSANEFISNPARYGAVDELDDVGVIPGHGDAWHVLEKRLGEYKTRVRCGLFGWAHPGIPGHGIAKIFKDDSDQREWTFDCPHCEGPISPDWDINVRIDENDPETAVFVCQHCGCEISDAQRWRATRAGRFESQLPPEEARKRRYIGFHVSKLCHPRITVLELAVTFCACTTEPQLKVFYNKDMGKPYLPASFMLTEEMIRQREREIGRRRIPEDTFVITCGVDVQKPKQNPTLYFVVSAWTVRGTEVVIEYGRVQGWSILDVLLREFHATAPSDREMRIALCMIDHGYETKQVYSFCRQDHAGVPCLPYKHTPGVKEDAPTRAKTTVDPLRPELGALSRIETCRTYWMERALGRFPVDLDEVNAGGIILPHGVDDEFVNHCLANIRSEELDEHGHPVVEYIKEVNRRDDWLQCLVAAEIGAVAKGLDRQHKAIPTAPPKRQKEIAEGLVEPESMTRQRARTEIYRGQRRSHRERKVW